MVQAEQAFQSVKLGFTWCYLLKCSGGFLLIDTAYPYYFQAFQAGLKKIGRALGEIKYLVLTHHHDDHAGFAAELAKTTGCRVIVHRNALMFLQRGQSEDVSRPVNSRVKLVFRFYELFHRSYNFPPVTVGENDVVLSDDNFEFLETIGIDGKLLYTPGHFSDCISLVLADGTAFVGDAAMNFLRWTGVGHRPIYAQDFEAVQASWRKLLEEGAKVIYPAHGRPFSAQEFVPRRF